MQYDVTNGHGDVTEIRDASGNILNQYSYDIWGNPEQTNETVPNNLRYAGEYWDETTGLQYLRARWYDPSVGRFITEDTFEGEATNPLSLHLYTYVENNPLQYVDPSGKGNKPANNVLLGLDNGSGSASAGRMTPGGSMDDGGGRGGSRSSSSSKPSTSNNGQSTKGASSAPVKDTGSISKNTANLREWAKEKGWVQQNTSGGVEQWGIKSKDGVFSWRLKIKPEASTREGLQAGSNQPRFDARLDDKGTYINPFTGETGGRSVGTHIPLGS
ncbi:RHS repeat-associated core domain-containing protein [Paenibacillus sp. FSL W8-0426]|uniref:RHS repeat-associated core domain-containing protein n=1 Tax=Paenibacillus sp. FSL W8-0426 TaxID=2921714 RepID=UPI0030D95957